MHGSKKRKDHPLLAVRY